MGTLGKRLTALRKDRHLSQEKLGEALGVSRQTIYNWEANIIRPKAENIKGICEYFGISIAEFYSAEEAQAESCATEVEQVEDVPFRRFMPALALVSFVLFVVALIFAIRCGCAAFTDNTAYVTVSTASFGIGDFVLALLCCIISLALAVVFAVQTKKSLSKRRAEE